jgi:hypothetical protein
MNCTWDASLSTLEVRAPRRGWTTIWLGYRLNPLYRAPGMSATSYMNLGMILYLLFNAFGA